jgi:peptidoglycan-associated lipoprotein
MKYLIIFLALTIDSALADASSDRVFFSFDSYQLSEQAMHELQPHIEYLKIHSDTGITIEGHTDERGTREYNLALGERRADAVRQFMKLMGVALTQMQIVSYGKERPSVVGSTERAWELNRRAVLVYPK